MSQLENSPGTVALVLAVLASGLACTAPVQGRFRDAPIVWQVNDSRDIPEPREILFYPRGWMLNGAVFAPVIRIFKPRRHGPAENTNALDEVPDSTWFENRIGVRRISPAEAARGPDLEGPPQAPMLITHAKRGGGNPGFLVKDRRGVRYLIKFDTAANPEQQTANNVIVNRIFWSLGYHVPADHVFHFTRDQLTLSSKLARSGKVTAADVDGMLSAATLAADGSYRATASTFLDGEAKGGWPTTGRRGDDANDHIDHERRRELRALRVFSAWLGHTDLKVDNTLDMYQEKDGRHYLKHYLVDFGEALGGHQSEHAQLPIGWEHFWHWKHQLGALASLGFWVRPWEGQKLTPWKSVGYFSASHFHPDGWHERYPYEPFAHLDRTDAYWAAKLVMRFDRPMLAAIVAAAQLSEPAAAAYLVDTLIARQRKIGSAYLDRVTPLDRFRFERGSLCLTDLARAHGIAIDGVVELRAAAGWRQYPEAASGEVCLSLDATGDYRILRLRVRRGTRTTPPMEIHYRPGARPRILGVVRAPTL